MRREMQEAVRALSDNNLERLLSERIRALKYEQDMCAVVWAELLKRKGPDS